MAEKVAGGLDVETLAMVFGAILIEVVAVGVDENDPARDRITDERLVELANKIDDISKRVADPELSGAFAKIAGFLTATERSGL